MRDGVKLLIAAAVGGLIGAALFGATDRAAADGLSLYGPGCPSMADVSAARGMLDKALRKFKQATRDRAFTETQAAAETDMHRAIVELARIEARRETAGCWGTTITSPASSGAPHRAPVAHERP